MSAAGATPTSGRGAVCATSQKEQVKTKDILKELDKLRVLYESNEQKINGFVPWGEMRRLQSMVEKLTRQRVGKPTRSQRKNIEGQTNNQRMETQLKRLKKIIGKLERESLPLKKELTNN